MKFAGKAFVGGMFGALGVAVAVLGTSGIILKLGERVIRKSIEGYEADMKAAYEQYHEKNER